MLRTKNHSMTQMEDRQLSRTTRFAYDAAERETLVDETWEPGRDTRSAYDPNGNVTERQTDGTWATPSGASSPSYQGGKATAYTYDVLDRERQMRVTQAGEAGARITSSEYHPSGELARRVKPNGVNEYTSYASDGRMSHMRRGMGAAAAPGKDLPYAYDRNGNRTTDERGSGAFNARDQLRTWTRSTGGAVSYEHDGSGAITRRQEGTDTETFAYNGERLASSTRNGVMKRYAYDEFGSMTKEGADLNNPDATYSYDAFERLTGGRGSGQAADTTYRYDGLDRRDYRTENGTRYDSSYVGSTEELSREQDPGKTQTYDYDSAGDSQGQATSQSGATSYRSFAKDANGSVEGLEGADGQIAPASRYAYDPYGKLENEQGISDPAARDNPIRFEGFRYDSGLKTYDMQARQYRPDIGRFLTQDRYESASGDLNLQSDPLTQNRYAFAGGNPVSRVEWDGHQSDDRIGNLTPAEVRFLKQHLTLAVPFRRATDLALSMTRWLFTGPGQEGADGTKANAFQHSFWVALMTYSGRGSKRGLQFAALHESRSIRNRSVGQRRLSRMDLHNNRIGYRYARNRIDTFPEQLCRGLLARARRAKRVQSPRSPSKLFRRKLLRQGRLYYRRRSNDETGDLVRYQLGRTCAKVPNSLPRTLLAPAPSRQ